MQIIGGIRNTAYNMGMEEEKGLDVKESEMWLEEEQEDVLGVVNENSMFYDDFPPLPEFPCMSSSSSSNSSTAPLQPLNTATTTSSSSTATSSSSSAVSWAVLTSHDGDDNHPPPPPLPNLSSTASTELPFPPAEMEGDDEPFPYLDLLEINDFLDPSFVFQDDQDCPLEEEYPHNIDHILDRHQQEQHALTLQPQQEDHHQDLHVISNNDGGHGDHNINKCCEEDIDVEGKGGNNPAVDGEMSDVFLEWLKTNKDSVSANDLRNVKLKKSTIECAAKRLGGGKEAMKQLLKLILEWVQTSHLQHKRRSLGSFIDNSNNDGTVPSNFLTSPTSIIHTNNSNNNNNSNPNLFGIPPSSCPSWASPPHPYATDPAATMPPYPFIGYPGDPFPNGAPNNHNINSYQQQPASAEFNMLEAAHSWPPSQLTAVVPHCSQSYGDNQGGPPMGVPAAGGYVNHQYSYSYFNNGVAGGDKLMRLGPSATKEARKKRMARQRRYLTHHRSQKHNGQLQHHDNNDPLARLGSDYNCTASGSHVNPANWLYWGSMAAGGAASLVPVVPAEPPRPALDRTAMQTQNYQTRVPSTEQRRQVSRLACMYKFMFVII